MILNVEHIFRAIERQIPANGRRSGSGFVSYCCPMCTLRGATRADRRFRGAMKREASRILITCLNCGFKAGWSPGSRFSPSLKSFLHNLGMAEYDIKRLALDAYRVHAFTTATNGATTIVFRPEFDEVALPPGTRSFLQCAEQGVDDPRFEAAVGYIASRGDDLWRPELYHWSAETKHDLDKRVIVPFWWKEKIVGYAARTFDPTVKPKYFVSTPSDFLFNADVMLKRERKYIVLVEGIFDSIAIDGVATQGARLNARQQQWINGCNKTVIVVPDRDDAGQRLIDVALANDWHVAFPRQASKYQVWDSDIKDTADAVQRYGRLFTLRGLLETATNNKNHISLLRKILTS